MRVTRTAVYPYCLVGLAAASVVGSSSVAAPRIIQLAGDDHAGYLSMSCLKNWGSASFAAQGLPDYPYFFKPDAFGGQGAWTSIVAEPLSPHSDYPEGDDAEIFNTSILDADFSTRPIGQLQFEDARLANVGTEFVPASEVTVVVDGPAFSPINSTHNFGSGVGNAGWDYTVEVTNLTGAGVVLDDGIAVAVDLVGDVSVTVRFLGIADGAFPETYDGSVRFGANRFAFDVDVTQDNVTLLGPVFDTRLVFNRSGTIESIPFSGCAADVNGDGAVDIDDLYVIHQHPVDVNGDGVADALDRNCLETFLRRNEIHDMSAGWR